MEEYDTWREQSPNGSAQGEQRRKLSFNPVDAWLPPKPYEEPVGAFEVSQTKRIGKPIGAVNCLDTCLLTTNAQFRFS